jgi:hypothetical protein
VFHKDFAVVLYITIIMAVDANDSVIRHFDSDARAGSHGVEWVDLLSIGG